MSVVAGVPHELRAVADVSRRAALGFAGHGDYLSSRWFPTMPPGVRAVVAEVMVGTARELREQATEMMADAALLAEAAYWFDLADGSETDFLGVLYGRDLTLARAREALAGLGADQSCSPALSSWGLGDWLGIARLDTAHPAEIADRFAQLGPAQAAYLLALFPEAIGPLDGVPLELRFAANRMLIQRAIGDLEAQLADGTDEFLEHKLQVFRGWAADDSRRFLLFDPTGDGRAAEVFGDIELAEDVAIVVPGMNNDITNFDGLALNAKRLLSHAELLSGGGAATIAWLGYDTPTVKDVLFADKARAAAPLLDRFVDGLIPYRAAHFSVVAHSYGGVATGLALKEGLDVDDVAFIGVPGTGPGIGNVGELETDAQIWAGKARFLPDVDLSDLDDPDSFVANVKEMEFVPTFGAHGEDPTEESFGGRRFRVNPIEASLEAGADPGNDGLVMGHSEYFDPNTTSLDNLAFIVLDEDDLVLEY